MNSFDFYIPYKSKVQRHRTSLQIQAVLPPAPTNKVDHLHDPKASRDLQEDLLHPVRVVLQAKVDKEHLDLVQHQMIVVVANEVQFVTIPENNKQPMSQLFRRSQSPQTNKMLENQYFVKGVDNQF